MKPLPEHIAEIRKGGFKELFRKLYTFFIYEFYHLISRFIFIIFLSYNYSKKNKNIKLNNNKKLLFGTIVWGDKYINYLLKFLIPSIFSKNNIPKLILEGYDVEYIFVIEKNQKIKDLILNTINFFLKKCNIFDSQIKIIFTEKETISRDMMSNLLIQIYEKSILDDSILTYTNADHIFSDKSIWNLVNMIDSNNCVVATGSFGVDEDKFINFYNNNKFNNTKEELINCSSKFFHTSILKSFKNHPDNSSWGSGVVIEELFDKNLLVTFSIPSTFTYKLDKSDLKFFKKNKFNVMDHSWPSKLMVERRLRVVPSSDICYILELRNNKFDIPLQSPNYLKYNYEPLRHITRRRMGTVLLSSFSYLLKLNT